MDAEPGVARYDPVLGSWILSSYADVTAALRDPRLSTAGADSADATMRRAPGVTPARASYAGRLTIWRVAMEASARLTAGSLPVGRTIDLVAGFARPWSNELAMKVTGPATADATRLIQLARDIFLAAATATDPQREAPALGATAELARGLPGADPTIAVQAFVALTQTLPCLLGGVWYELFRRPDLAEHMRAEPGIVPKAVEELLRLASPGRAVFRLAVEDIEVGELRINSGDRVILMLAAANRDPTQFRDPVEVDLLRNGKAHLTFGDGPHSCVGASIVRMAVGVATQALLESTNDVEVIGPLEWTGGFAIRAPASLPVRLTRNPRNLRADEPDAH